MVELLARILPKNGADQFRRQGRPMLLGTWKRVVEESWYLPVLLGGAAAVGAPLDFLLYIIPFMAVVYGFATFGIALVLNAIRGRKQGEK